MNDNRPSLPYNGTPTEPVIQVIETRSREERNAWWVQPLIGLIIVALILGFYLATTPKSRQYCPNGEPYYSGQHNAAVTAGVAQPDNPCP